MMQIFRFLMLRMMGCILFMNVCAHAEDTGFSRMLNDCVQQKTVAPDQIFKLLMSHPYQSKDTACKAVPFAPQKKATDAEFNAIVGAIDYARTPIIDFFENNAGIQSIVNTAHHARYVYGQCILSPQDAVDAAVQASMSAAHHKQLLIYYLLATRGESDYTKSQNVFAQKVSALNAQNPQHPIFQKISPETVRTRLLKHIHPSLMSTSVGVFYNVSMDALTQDIMTKRRAVGLFQSSQKCPNPDCGRSYLVIDVAKEGNDCRCLTCQCPQSDIKNAGIIKAFQEWTTVQQKKIFPAPGAYYTPINIPPR